MLPTEAPDLRRSPWLLVVCSCLAAVTLGYAIHLRDGEYSYQDGYNPLVAIHWVGIGLVLALAGVAFSYSPRPRWAERAGWIVLAAGLGFQFVQLLRSPPSGWNPWSNDLRPIDVSQRPYYAGVTAAAVLSVGLFFRGPIVRRTCLSLLLAVHLLLGCWMVRATPAPRIDVYLFQQEGPAALLRGQNPYAQTFDDLYRSDQPGERRVYGDGIARDGRVNFGFPYPPVSLLISTAGYAVAGDYRYAQAVCMTLAGALLALARPGRTAAVAGALLLFTPRAFFVLGRGWSEPQVAALLAATVFCACRVPRLLPVALGLLLACKQYLVLAGPAVVVLALAERDGRRAWGLLWKSAAVALVVTLPLALWDPKAFWFSTVTVQKEAPFRDDALSFLVAWKRHVGPTLLDRPLDRAGPLVAFAAAAVGAAAALWRAPRSAAGFAAAVAATLLPFIAFNKQAFANYYYFTIACLCAALAAACPGDTRVHGEFADELPAVA